MRICSEFVSKICFWFLEADAMILTSFDMAWYAFFIKKAQKE